MTKALKIIFKKIITNNFHNRNAEHTYSHKLTFAREKTWQKKKHDILISNEYMYTIVTQRYAPVEPLYVYVINLCSYCVVSQ